MMIALDTTTIGTWPFAERNKMQIIDLTHSIENGMPHFNAPWHSQTTLEQMGSIDNVGRNTTNLNIGSHCGTHIDAPAHFIEGGRTIDEIKLSELMGPVSIFDFSFLQENECITLDMLKNIKLSEKVIFYFNWAKYFKTDKFYKNYPYFSDEAADYLVECKVKLIGMDTPSPDDSRIKMGSEDDSKIHKKFLNKNIILIEYLNNLAGIQNFNDWNLIAFPLKLKKCDGSSARVCIYKG